MADEEIRDEEPEVEAHGARGDKIEGARGAQDDDSDDVEAHGSRGDKIEGARGAQDDDSDDVEAHGARGDKIEGARGAYDEDDSDDFEAHSFKMGGKAGTHPNFKEGGKA